ncbi:adenine specific DNA methyltransferase [Burkholderia pseudomallei]|uniref:type ISP restriction/modification enzyme n=1 Tax=Burkholderia pseudomallei TaxID=28450 RepID=UPI000F08E418|nr:type ISP restriction/modification enzyme [Burkholderia pseudomallei]VBM56233.1 adenine specific DNA methyltransferase [Burkholderia pseudomallei]
MSQTLIGHYLNELDRLRQTSGSRRESVLREAFKDLLKAWGRQHDLVFVPEYELDTPTKERRYVDGALLHELRVPFGYWEAKDENDDLDLEIAAKFKRGYPQDNIIFEDSRQAVLIQHRAEVMRCDVTNVEKLEKLLKLFFAYERPEIASFRKAVNQFKTDLPAVLTALRQMIDRQYSSNSAFRRAAAKFLKHVQDAINPVLSEADVREMLIQHVLTEEIFAKVFDDSDFHRKNNVAHELYKLEETFFTGGLKKATLKGLEPYYAAIRSTAAQIASHHEKQTFLKVIYENFYKVYNAKAADRLGVVYTPNEVVRFMIDGADWLCERHFGKSLIERDVEILDPATGTGTFISELLEHFRGQSKKLERKYRNELHANEVAILPYYVANLNIEATYAAITGEYEEFSNLCFVDTLDNVGLHTQAHGTTADLFGSVSDENVARIKRQNSRKISVIIGNPPYNANQANENDNNKNRRYPAIDARIKQTYIAESTAQKTKLYDMYARFFRWASDRLDSNGVLAFVTNRSFIDSRTFDGFRKTVAAEFAEVYVVDLGGDVRVNPKLSGTKHNVFGIQTGVAISFFVKKAGKRDRARIFYARRPEMETAEEKLAFLSQARLAALTMDEIKPDPKSNWLDLTYNDYEELIPLVDGFGKGRAVFDLTTNGVNTARDEWVYDFDAKHLATRMRFAVQEFNGEQEKWKAKASLDRERLSKRIKWSEGLLAKLTRKPAPAVSVSAIVSAHYRPFCSLKYYAEPTFSDRLTANHFELFGAKLKSETRCIAISAPNSAGGFRVLATDRIADWHFMGDTRLCGAYRFDAEGMAHDNVSDWVLKKFTSHYKAGPGKRLIEPTKEGIFHYIYAVLHDPVYREEYALNLKREIPRVPLYGNLRAHFWRWAEHGRALMDLHIGYEGIEPWPLKRNDLSDKKARAAGLTPKCILRSMPDAGRIVVDSETTLDGIPIEAWSYRLGNRSAIDWVLDQYKEKSVKDSTIREKFDSYSFADYKEHVVALLARIVRVSVETAHIVKALEVEPR